MNQTNIQVPRTAKAKEKMAHPIGWNWGRDYNILIKYQPTDTRYCISTFRIIQRGGFCKWHMQLEMKKDGAQKAGTALAYGS